MLRARFREFQLLILRMFRVREEDTFRLEGDNDSFVLDFVDKKPYERKLAVYINCWASSHSM
jgi:hypothetical protein